MKTFHVFVKGRADPVIVRAEKVVVHPASGDGALKFTIGEEIVAEFLVAEIQGWQQMEPGRASGR